MTITLDVYYGKREVTDTGIIEFLAWLVSIKTELATISIPDITNTVNASGSDDTGKLIASITVSYPKTEHFTTTDLAQIRTFIKTKIRDTMPEGAYLKKRWEWKP